MTVRTKKVAPKSQHLAYRDALIATMRQYAADFPADEMLAVTAHLLGSIVAMQDRTRMTSEIVMKVIADNIEVGNQEALAQIKRNK
jgi:hypothetical protein